MSNALKKRWKYEDPNPEDHGVLLSDQIHELCDVGLLVSSGYGESNLRPASYTLRIGNTYVDSKGKTRQLTDDQDSLTLEKNSIVFVSTLEELDLPYYIIGRFNLRVKWVYDGILLGTGPQVDPGFQGRLSCPLYNLTNFDITIKRKQAFATIDFVKTTPFLKGVDYAKKRELVQQQEPFGSVGRVKLDNRQYLLYPQGFMGALQLRDAHELVSSLMEIRREVRTWRYVGIGVVTGFLALALSMISFGSNLYQFIVQNSRQLDAVEARVVSIDEKTKQLETSLQELEISRAAAQKKERGKGSAENPAAATPGAREE